MSLDTVFGGVFCSTLPDVLVSSTPYIQYLSFYRQALADALISDAVDSQSTGRHKFRPISVKNVLAITAIQAALECHILTFAHTVRESPEKSSVSFYRVLSVFRADSQSSFGELSRCHRTK